MVTHDGMSEDWGACIVAPIAPPADLLAEYRRRRRGPVPDWVGHLAACPWLVAALRDLTMGPIARLSRRLWDLTELIVSRDNSCRYCYGTQRAYMRILGYDEAEIARIERDLHGGDLAPGEAAALEFARKVSHAQPRPGAAERAVVAAAGLDRVAIAELALASAAAVFANRVSTILALPTEWVVTQMDTLWMRVLRPVLAWNLRRGGSPPMTPLVANGGPWAALVDALAGSPAAGVVRRVVDDADASPILPRRTKLLMTAVVARALGSAYGESEARAGLAAEGVTAPVVDEVLANLGSSALDAREARLVPFARETVRYHRNLAVQTRLREVGAGLSSAEILEVVGTLGLANALCRLSVLVE